MVSGSTPRDHGLMAFEILDGPRIERRPALPTLGIRVVTPFRGMLAARDSLITELSAWLTERRIETTGPFFLRMHTVNMAGDMDIEVGVLDTTHDGDDRVRVGSAPHRRLRTHRVSGQLDAGEQDPTRMGAPPGSEFRCRYELRIMGRSFRVPADRSAK